MKCTLFIPAYNEAPVIGLTVATLGEALSLESDIDWHITVVDNASSDGTADVVRALGDTRVSVLTLTKKGKGLAVRSGFNFLPPLTTDAVVGFTDSDLSVPPHEIIAALRNVEHGDADVVIGSRLHKDSTMPGREWWRVGSSEIFNLLAKSIVGIRVSDTQCPLKVMNEKGARIMRATLECTWFMDLEFLALCERTGLRVVEVPVTWDEHRYPDRKSKLSTTRDGLRAVVAMFRIRSKLSTQLSLLR